MKIKLRKSRGSVLFMLEAEGDREAADLRRAVVAGRCDWVAIVANLRLMGYEAGGVVKRARSYEIALTRSATGNRQHPGRKPQKKRKQTGEKGESPDLLNGWVH